jgi:hypothetical protein
MRKFAEARHLDRQIAGADQTTANVVADRV